MGWFSNAVKNLRPDKVMKDPKRMMQMQLSPQAQALYDQMKARTAERQAAKQAQSQQPVPQQVVQQLAGSARLADGGQPKRKHMADCQHFESKVFERKKNGKPS